MLLSLVYFALRHLVRALAPSDRMDLEREVELLVLRHQVRVLSRGVRRPPLHVGTGCCSPQRAGSCPGGGGKPSS